MKHIIVWTLFLGTASHPVRQHRDQNDLFCGPRCVCFVLESYGRRTELLDVIREAQWPDMERGTSLASLKHVLERHGVGTTGIEMQHPSLFAWNFLSIIHLKPDVRNTGHFVVLLPYEDSGKVTIWNGLSGFQTHTPDWLEHRMSGIVLLTAPVPFDSQMFPKPTSAFYWNNAACFGVGVLIVAVPALCVWGAPYVYRVTFRKEEV